MGGFLVSGELLAVVVRDRMDMVAQGIQTMDRGTVGRRRTGQFRDGGEQAFALDMGEEGALMMCAHNGIALPVAEPCLAVNDRRTFRNVDTMRDDAAPRRL